MVIDLSFTGARIRIKTREDADSRRHVVIGRNDDHMQDKIRDPSFLSYQLIKMPALLKDDKSISMRVNLRCWTRFKPI